MLITSCLDMLYFFSPVYLSLKLNRNLYLEEFRENVKKYTVAKECFVISGNSYASKYLAIRECIYVLVI